MAKTTGSPVWRDNFAELKKPLVREEARVEASRCLYCYDAPCVKACPTHIDIPRFIRQIAAADPLGSGQTILEANALGHSCARVCPVEVLCEGDCVYHDWHEKPIQIARLQRYATDAVHADDALPFEPGEDNGKRVAVVGAGPSGVACAVYLRRLGYAVTIFEKRPLPGGLNTFGVAEYKMDEKTSLEELRLLFRLGCDVVTGKEIGKDLKAEKLLKDFDAVFLGVGLAKAKGLGIPGEDLPGVTDALAFIERVKNHDGKILEASKATVVIGGGNTAIDACTQSSRTGTAQVVLAYRRGRADMSAYDFEIELAKVDGASLLMNAAPKRILGKKKVEGVEFARTKTVNGKLVETKETFTVKCDRVIKAIGQEKDSKIAELFRVATNGNGTVKADGKTLATSNRKIFAGGDLINGGKEVVNAAADGKRAAWGIHASLHPGAKPGPDDAYWVSTIEGRIVAPIMPREEHA
ncbi:MAG TPA: NAD(P)-dependent oxidoreductase [Elusimicrobiota bacterium]|nr:NAD(P)-dependent oxidoreductase [Elusimicrobiota bacterium]